MGSTIAGKCLYSICESVALLLLKNSGGVGENAPCRMNHNLLKSRQDPATILDLLPKELKNYCSEKNETKEMVISILFRSFSKNFKTGCSVLNSGRRISIIKVVS